MPGSFKTSATRLPFRVLARFATVAVAVLWLAGGYSTEVVTALLPAVQAEMTVLDRDFAILSLDVHPDGSARTIRLRADVAHTLFVRGRAIHPLGDRPGAQGWYQVNINARGVLPSALLFLIAVLGWPEKSPRETLVRILLAIPLVTLLILVDIPLELLGNLHEVVARQVDPQGFRLLFAGDKWLDGGGDFALALGAATVVITFSAKGLSWRKRIQRGSPQEIDLRKTVKIRVWCYRICRRSGLVNPRTLRTADTPERPVGELWVALAGTVGRGKRLGFASRASEGAPCRSERTARPGAIRLGTAIRSNNPTESHRQSAESRR